MTNPWLKQHESMAADWPAFWQDEHEKEYQRQRTSPLVTDDVAYIFAVRIIEARRNRMKEQARREERRLEHATD